MLNVECFPVYHYLVARHEARIRSRRHRHVSVKSIFWYIVRFTATFGWKVSWQWWYSGIFACLFNFTIYDLLVTTIHWMFNGCSGKLWLWIMKVRSIKFATPEVVKLRDE